MANPLCDVVVGEDERGVRINMETVEMMTTNAMKDFLRARCWAVTGDRTTLVSRVFTCLERNIEPVVQGLEYIKVRNVQYQSILTRADIEDPIQIVDGWVKEKDPNGLSGWPSLTFINMTTWLAEHEQLTKYKLDKAFQYYKQGWSKEIEFLRVPRRKLCILKNVCSRSQAVSGPPHEVWVCFDTEEAEVKAAFCTCVAGLSETCNHVTALLYRVENAVRQGLTACTANLASWNVPSRTTTVDPTVTLDDYLIDWHRSTFEKQKPTRLIYSVKRSRFDPVTPLKLVGDILSERERYIAVCTASSKTAAMARMSCVIDEEPVPRMMVHEKLPTMKDIFEEYVAQTGGNDATDFVLTFLPRYFQDRPDLAQKIGEQTIEQRKTRVWFEQRAHRITATSVAKVSRRQLRLAKKPGIDNFSLVNSLLPNKRRIDTEATRWGIAHEPDARQAYIEMAKNEHIDFRYEECGLVVDPRCPFLGASPDGLVTCVCCGEGLVEFKCPFTIRFKDPNRNLPTYMNASGLKVNHSSGYYDQVQCQMALTGRKYCDFFVWTMIQSPDEPGDLVIGEERGTPLLRRIHFDEEYWNATLARLATFYVNELAPVFFLGQSIRRA